MGRLAPAPSASTYSGTYRNSQTQSHMARGVGRVSTLGWKWDIIPSTGSISLKRLRDLGIASIVTAYVLCPILMSGIPPT